MLHTLQTVSKRLMALGFDPGRAGNLAHFILKQVECRGPSGAVEVLKRFSLYFKQMLGGGDPDPSYIRVGSDGWPLRLRWCRKLPSELHHVLFSLHRFVFVPTQKENEIDKMVRTVMSEPAVVDENLQQIVREGCETLPKVRWHSLQTPVALLAYRRVCEHNTGDDLWVKARKRFKKEYGFFKQLPLEIQLHSGWGKAFPGLTTRTRSRMDFLIGNSWLPEDNFVGSYKVEPEPGGKFRLSASPYLLYQSVSEPMYRSLMGVLHRIGQDCTYNQEKGPVLIREWLREGRTVYSYDLSSATDLFPLYLQITLLHQLGIPEEDIKLFEFVSRGSYRAWQDGYKDIVLSWTRGQPLGFKPSFSVFALTHHALMRGLASKLGVPMDYLILGDDVAIGNQSLAEAYAEVMTQLGILNRTKGLVSCHAAEFASRYVTREQVFRTGKHRPVDDSNLESMVELYGAQAVTVAETPKQKAVTRWMIGDVPGFEEALASFHDQARLEPREDDCTTPQGIVERLNWGLPTGGSDIDYRFTDEYLRSWIRPLVTVKSTLYQRVGITHALHHLWILSTENVELPVLRQVGEAYGFVAHTTAGLQRKLLANLVPWSIRGARKTRASALASTIIKVVRENSGVKHVLFLRDGTVKPITLVSTGVNHS